ncbi:MAG: hypothetical protein RLP44_17415 [Aggregatilineales bacterium]
MTLTQGSQELTLGVGDYSYSTIFHPSKLIDKWKFKICTSCRDRISVEVEMLSFVETIKSRIHKQARHSKNYVKITDENRLKIETAAETETGEILCGLFIPVIHETAYILFTDLGMHWVENEQKTTFLYANLSEVDIARSRKKHLRTIVLITKSGQEIDFPKMYEYPVLEFLAFSIFVVRVLDAYKARQ